LAAIRGSWLRWHPWCASVSRMSPTVTASRWHRGVPRQICVRPVVAQIRELTVALYAGLIRDGTHR
jgi:hypothetical protein